MNLMELEARAKINLSLDVLNRRNDGYHNVRMIMQTIELHDTVRIRPIPKGIEIICNNPWVPNDERNIAHKAADLIIDYCNIKNGVSIEIDKCIPVAAGLAGGSTDAAAVLKGINQLFSLGLDQPTLMSLGKQIGADVPYCINGGTMLAEGIGEILTGIGSLSGVNIVLIKPKIGVSTAWVYKNLQAGSIKDRPDTDRLIEAVRKQEIDIVAQNMKNVLETVTIKKYGIIEEIKARLVEEGALGSMMSGSGPSVFGIFKDRQSAQSAYENMECNEWDRYLTYTI